jgi:pyruvate formate lyase activating enzyme
MKTALVLEIKGNSLDDGPGIRSVVFFKGCPLSCVWCHNPESKARQVEIAFDGEQCVACDTCLAVCPEKALSRDLPCFIDRARCSLCFACADECPSGALSRVGTPTSVDKIVQTVLKDRIFFKNSGGGVTLSGGEPTLAMGFAGELLKALKREGIHTLMETCGLFDSDRFEQILYPFLDVIYFDIKLMDDTRHRHYCGTSNRVILKNFQYLYQRFEEGGVEILPRTPLIPGITDTDQNLRAIVDFLQDCGAEKAVLLEYHPLWREKNRKLGLPDPQEGLDELASFSSREHLARCRCIFLDAGIQV